MAVKKLVAAIDARVRKRRRETGNTTLEVSIYGPDGETIIHMVDVNVGL